MKKLTRGVFYEMGSVYLLVCYSSFFNSSGVAAQKLLLTYDGAVHEYTGNIFSLKVNGDTIKSDIPPIIINGRSLVPVRAIFEKLGAQVFWDATEKKVTVSYNGKDIVLKINDTYATVNGEKVKMEVPAKIINDRTVCLCVLLVRALTWRLVGILKRVKSQ